MSGRSSRSGRSGRSGRRASPHGGGRGSKRHSIHIGTKLRKVHRVGDTRTPDYIDGISCEPPDRTIPVETWERGGWLRKGVSLFTG